MKTTSKQIHVSKTNFTAVNAVFANSHSLLNHHRILMFHVSKIAALGGRGGGPASVVVLGSPRSVLPAAATAPQRALLSSTARTRCHPARLLLPLPSSTLSRRQSRVNQLAASSTSSSVRFYSEPGKPDPTPIQVIRKELEKKNLTFYCTIRNAFASAFSGIRSKYIVNRSDLSSNLSLLLKTLI